MMVDLADRLYVRHCLNPTDNMDEWVGGCMGGWMYGWVIVNVHLY